MKQYTFISLLIILALQPGCKSTGESSDAQTFQKIPVIFDTDANNELDDQHALAYLLFNGETFTVEGVTVNTTRSGGGIENHYAEAERIIKLCKLDGTIPLFKGADQDFLRIRDHLASSAFDGSDAVNFIIEKARVKRDRKLVLIAVGKLTNVALALEKEPSITESVKVVWLGSNYPEPGEYNQENDPAAMSYVLRTNVEFDMVTVRYGRESGTDAVKVTQEEINFKMPGKGPRVDSPVMGRHGIAFDNFGDYSVNLFEHIDFYGDPPSRALFDMAAVAIVKNPSWAESKRISCPVLIDNEWQERPENPRKITLWENFNRDKIIEDLFRTMEEYTLVN
jgi:purine nucleosidase